MPPVAARADASTQDGTAKLKIVRFSTADTRTPRWGHLVGGDIFVLDGDPLVGPVQGAGRVPTAAVRLLAPLARPSKVVALGRNYASHVAEMGWHAGEQPVVFLKPPSSIVGPGDPICLPPESAHCEAEGELAVVIGARGRRIPAADSSRYIFGYTVANDVSARDLMVDDGQWSRAKGYDSFCPLGPWIDTDFDPTAVGITTVIDGDLVQRGNTAEMRIGVPELVAHVSRSFRLEPGDLILTGSPAGRRTLREGMVVSVSIDGLGTLTNPVVEESNIGEPALS
ncbi:fumarylacetoacetate hydrolase family protein [Nocardia sp. NPDC058176]|uniref:fumarylacetoacetate hydrolase family protein n=1 Tax=Nocardia sp. NPDC058176 TaxID=3346368 RepID=UPI0036D9069F